MSGRLSSGFRYAPSAPMTSPTMASPAPTSPRTRSPRQRPEWRDNRRQHRRQHYPRRQQQHRHHRHHHVADQGITAPTSPRTPSRVPTWPRLPARVAGADPATTNSIFVSVPAGTYIVYGRAMVTNECTGNCVLQESACSIDGTQVATSSVLQTVFEDLPNEGARGSTPRVKSQSPASVLESS